MKKGIRILGIDDSPFTKKDKKVLVVGVVQRTGIIEGIISTNVKRDGRDGTKMLHKMMANSKFLPQIKMIIMNGIMMAGFNVIDINWLSKKLKIPIAAITRRKPNMIDVKKALKKFKDFEKKWKLTLAAGPSQEINVKGRRLFVQVAGMDAKEVEHLLNVFGLDALRIAHLMGSGIVRGESYGRI